MSKYHAVPTVVEGIRFASKAEARRYQELRLLERAGQIAELVIQPSWALEVEGRHIARYVADFAYVVTKTAEYVVEDVKGVRTPVYKLKKKLVEALHALTITEVTR